MTISYVEPVKTYVSSGNGNYPFTFKILAESDIEVWYTSASTGARVQLVRGSDFSVTIGNPGGTVTILGNAPAGGQILIQRRVPIDQPTDWVNNGPFDMDLLESDLDRIIMIVQQLAWDVSSGQAALNWRGPWVTTNAYTASDWVKTSNGNYYFCIVSHTAGTFTADLAAGKWVLVLDFAAVQTQATNAAASAADALASRNTAIARSAAAELSEIAAAASEVAAAQSASNAAASAANILDWPVSTGLATDVAALLAIGRKNLLVNGGFDVWQRGTSFNVGNVYTYTADRWYAYCPRMGAGTIFERRAFTIGQTDVPFNPSYYLRCTMDVDSATTAGTLRYKIPNVAFLSGREVTLSFYAKADAAKYIAVNAIQYFGSGGSGSATAYDYAEKATLTTSWVRKSFTFTMPSVSGKTIGTGDTYTDIYIFMSYDSMPNVGNPSGSEMVAQEGVFDFANVQLEFGDTATDFEYRHPAEELALCQWYYEKATMETIGVAVEPTQVQLAHMSYAPKRKTPVITWPAPLVNTLTGTPGAIIDASARTHGFAPTLDWTGATTGQVGRLRYADVIFDAEIY